MLEHCESDDVPDDDEDDADDEASNAELLGERQLPFSVAVVGTGIGLD